MKTILAFVALALGPSLAFAQFDLDKVDSILCTDSAPTADINVTLLTYPDGLFGERKSGEILYKYGNQMGFFSAQAGTLTVVNNPSTDLGVVVLQDVGLPDTTQTLRLTPKADGKYSGLLTGHISLSHDRWITIQDRPMNCEVSFARIPRMH